MAGCSPTRVAILPILAFALLVAASVACASITPEVIPPTSPPSLAAGGEVVPTEAIIEHTTPPPTESARVNSSPTNPVPFGSKIKAADVTLSVTGFVWNVDDIVLRDPSNPTPVPGSHYLLAGIATTCNLSADESCHLTLTEFSLIDMTGAVHDVVSDVAQSSVAMQATLLNDGDFDGGATMQGFLVFTAHCATESCGLILRYKEPSGGEAYFDLQ